MPRQSKPAYHASPTAETQFARALRKVGRHSGHLVEMHVDGHTIKDPAELKAALEAYSRKLGPWANKQAAKMVEKVSRVNRKQMRKQSQEMSKHLALSDADGQVAQHANTLMQESVGYIKSIPLDAALRAQNLAMEAQFGRKRADEVAEELARSGEVSESKAMLIARTEVARANASINQARAEAVGSNQYRWRNSGDAAVRHSHKMYHGKKLDGMIFDWDHPPTLDDGTTGNPGTFPNCRCYAEPVFSD